MEETSVFLYHSSLRQGMIMVKCLRMCLKILNFVLNGIGKSENCVLNRVRV